MTLPVDDEIQDGRSPWGQAIIVAGVAGAAVLVVLYGARANYTATDRAAQDDVAVRAAKEHNDGAKARGQNVGRDSAVRTEASGAHQMEANSWANRLRFAYRTARPGIPKGPRGQRVFEASIWIDSPPEAMTRVEYVMRHPAYTYKNPIVSTDRSTSFRGTHHYFGCIDTITVHATIGEKVETLADIDWCARLNVDRNFEPRSEAIPLSVRNATPQALCSVRVKSQGEYDELSPARLEPGAVGTADAFGGQFIDVRAELCDRPGIVLRLLDQAIASEARRAELSFSRTSHNLESYRRLSPRDG